MKKKKSRIRGTLNLSVCADSISKTNDKQGKTGESKWTLLKKGWNNRGAFPQLLYILTYSDFAYGKQHTARSHNILETRNTLSILTMNYLLCIPRFVKSQLNATSYFFKSLLEETCVFVMNISSLKKLFTIFFTIFFIFIFQVSVKLFADPG